MELRYSPTSPFARKVLIIAHELGIADRIKLVRNDPRAESDALVPYNPLSKIPAFVAENGDVLFDSPVICEYVDAEFGNNRFIPKSGPRRWQVLTVAALGDGILDAAILTRQERARPAQQQSPEYIAWQLKKVRGGLDRLESTLDSFGSEPDLRHVAVATALGYLDFRMSGDGFFENRPRVKGWFTAISQRPSLRATAPKE